MTETIDTANLRELAEASKAWMKNPAAWIVPGSKGVAFFGSVLDGEKYEIGQVDTENYYQETAALPLAQFIAAANPATIIALLDRLAAAEARNATLTDEAARYRWLRHGDNDERMLGSDCRGLYLPRNERLDEGIDREMAKDAAAQWAPVSAEQAAAIDSALGITRAAASISTKGDGHDQG